MRSEIEDGMGFAGHDPRLTPEERHIERLERELRRKQSLVAAMQAVVNAASILERAMSGTDDEAGDDEMYALFKAVEAYRKQLEQNK